MSSKIISKEKNTVTLEFTVTQEEFEKSINKAYLKIRGKINIPGFRKGKAPKKIIEARYGKNIFYEDALDIAIPDAYSKAIEENKLDVIDQPKIDIKEFEEEKDIIITAEVEVMPEVELCEYKGIEVEKVEYNVTDEDVENEIKNIQDKNARILEVEGRSVQQGDMLTIDYKGFISEEQFEGGTAENYTLEIGSNSFIPGFEEQLVGKNKDDEVEVNVTFPEEYHAEDLKGKDAKFIVKIHEIKEKELPELDDEFAKDVSEFDTLEEFKEDTKKTMIQKSKDSEKIANENNVITKIVDNCKVDVPQVMIDREVEYQGKNYEQQIRMQGFNGKEMEAFIKQIVDQYKKNYAKQAEFNVKTELVLSEVIKFENIDVTEEDIDTELKKMAENYNLEDEKVQDFVENMKKNNVDYIKDGIKKRKAIEFLIENAKIIEPKKEAKESKKATEKPDAKVEKEEKEEK